jgi:cytochrome c2
MHTRFVLLLTALFVAPFAWVPMSMSMQIDIIPGSAKNGAEVFRGKDCVQCHSINGAGGSVAPDLAQPGSRAHTPMELASALWNHAPRMWRAQAARHIRPMIDSTETADLFAYFYSLSYFNAPGNAARGAALFEEKRCSSCHELNPSAPSARREKKLGPPVSTWRNADDVLAWAERMWNHSGKIYNELAQMGIVWPRFSTQEMVDLLTYLRSLPEARSQLARFQPGDPEQGRILFERSCESCHSFGSRTTGAKVDLLKRAAPDGLTGYIAAMWNHAPVMHAKAENQFPILGPGDMSNLVAYLFAQRYFYQEGNAQRGAQVFQAKNCATCHEQRRKQTGAADLTMVTERYSPITMSAAVWQHGPAMLDKMQREKIEWPQLSPMEMADLISYLNSRLVPRIAGPDTKN